jgi:hypothetical protein
VGRSQLSSPTGCLLESEYEALAKTLHERNLIKLDSTQVYIQKNHTSMYT